MQLPILLEANHYMAASILTILVDGSTQNFAILRDASLSSWSNTWRLAYAFGLTNSAWILWIFWATLKTNSKRSKELMQLGEDYASYSAETFRDVSQLPPVRDAGVCEVIYYLSAFSYSSSLAGIASNMFQGAAQLNGACSSTSIKHKSKPHCVLPRFHQATNELLSFKKTRIAFGRKHSFNKETYITYANNAFL